MSVEEMLKEIYSLNGELDDRLKSLSKTIDKILEQYEAEDIEEIRDNYFLLTILIKDDEE